MITSRTSDVRDIHLEKGAVQKAKINQASYQTASTNSKYIQRNFAAQNDFLRKIESPFGVFRLSRKVIIFFYEGGGVLIKNSDQEDIYF
mgnify:CR=1 FL=1